MLITQLRIKIIKIVNNPRINTDNMANLLLYNIRVNITKFVLLYDH